MSKPFTIIDEKKIATENTIYDYLKDYKPKKKINKANGLVYPKPKGEEDMRYISNMKCHKFPYACEGSSPNEKHWLDLKGDTAEALLRMRPEWECIYCKRESRLLN